MIENEINLYFFDWFKNYSEEHNLEYPSVIKKYIH